MRLTEERVAGLEHNETKLPAFRPFLERLRDLGRARAKALLARQGDALGLRSTLDLHR